MYRSEGGQAGHEVGRTAIQFHFHTENVDLFILCTQASKRVRESVRVCTCMCVCEHARVHVCACMCACMHMCVYVCMFVCVCVGVFVQQYL